ncbi:MAG: cytidine deaminase [Euryarchaeota archaeon]|nr:cytidine deaminase [Euryarchaeota archaeon]
MDTSELVAMAKNARENAYAPYSSFRVGAAVVSDIGVFTGANVENASYGLTMCAERVAIFSAISAGAKEITEVAVFAESMPYPCGACLQVMEEFCTPECRVIVADPKNIKILTLRELLPHPFSKDTL